MKSLKERGWRGWRRQSVTYRYREFPVPVRHTLSSSSSSPPFLLMISWSNVAAWNINVNFTSQYWYTLFCREAILSRIYTLLSVKFSGLKMCECKKNDKYQVCSLNNFSDTVRGWRLMFQRWGKASIVFLKGKPSLQKKCFANGHCPFEGVAGGRPLYVWFGPLLHQVIVLNKLIDSSLTITRAQPGNETVFLKPSSKFRLYSREENVSTSTDTENLDVDFKVFVPLPVLKMNYIDEDLHIRRQLTVELTGNGRMVQYEVLYDKLKNTMIMVHDRAEFVIDQDFHQCHSHVQDDCSRANFDT